MLQENFDFVKDPANPEDEQNDNLEAQDEKTPMQKQLESNLGDVESINKMKEDRRSAREKRNARGRSKRGPVSKVMSSFMDEEKMKMKTYS